MAVKPDMTAAVMMITRPDQCTSTVEASALVERLTVMMPAVRTRRVVQWRTERGL
jgi:hypothetical protein